MARKGEKQSLETIKKRTSKVLGQKRVFYSPTKFKKGRIPWNKGLTAETDVRVKKNTQGQERKRKIGDYNRGKTKPEEVGKKISLAKIGHPVYKTAGYLKHLENMRSKIKHRKISKAEIVFKDYLDKYEIEYIHQYKYLLGISDFYLPNKNLIIECDGKYWHSFEHAKQKDIKKREWLQNNNYNVLVLSSEQIMQHRKNLSAFLTIQDFK